MTTAKRIHQKAPANGRPYCRTCRHWFRDDVNRQIEQGGVTFPDDRGLCRRYPPVLVVVQNILKNRFPMAHPTATCGEWLET